MKQLTIEKTEEKLYSFAYLKGIKFNTIYEQIIKEDCNGNSVILFHGAKNASSMPVDYINSIVYHTLNNGKGNITL